MTSLAADHAMLMEAVREAGALALSFFRQGPKTWKKDAGDPVSEADIAVDVLLRERLHAPRPDYAWLSEESEDDPVRIDHRRVWIVDPIDGTRAFLEERPEFTVVAALVEDGRPLLGAVYNPATDEFFDAVKGGGARLNGKTITVSDRGDFNDARLLASARMVKRTIETMSTRPATYDAVNSVAYRMALVACGKYDATLSLGPKSDWDIAAADLVVTEAGGLSTDASGARFVYNGAVPRHPSLAVANPALHTRLLEVVESLD